MCYMISPYYCLSATHNFKNYVTKDPLSNGYRKTMFVSSSAAKCLTDSRDNYFPIVLYFVLFFDLFFDLILR